MWYSQGTITATNNNTVINGVGTGFLQGVRVGDGITIAGSTSLHEVISVASNTQLTIKPAYTGTTGAGKQYAVAPILGYDKDLSDAFNQLRLQFGDQLSNLQPWATASTLDDAHTKFGLSDSGKAVATGTPAQGRAALDVPSSTSLKQASPSILIVDQLRASVEAATGGRQTVIYTNAGNPSYMYVFPAFNCEDIAPGGELGTGTYPAFLSNGVRESEIFVGAHLGGMMGSQVVSHPGLDPRASINFDKARALCKANGPGWDMMSNLDWAAIALWCMANGYQPRGNTNYGRSHEKRWETGRRQDGGEPGNTAGTARTLTGSGGKTWAHDGTDSGIHDLVGNVWEWVTGMKLVNGRAWIAPDNGQTEEAQLIDSGFDMTDANPWSSHTSVGASDLVKQSLLAPASPALSPVGRLYVNAKGERIPLRGGRWNSAGAAGLGALGLHNVRTLVDTGIGFRPRFRNP